MPECSQTEAAQRERHGQKTDASGNHVLAPEAARIAARIDNAQGFHKADDARRGAPQRGDQTEGKKTGGVIDQAENRREDQMLGINREIGDDPSGERLPEQSGRQPADNHGEHQAKWKKREREEKGNFRCQVEAVVGLNPLPDSAEDVGWRVR